ncbi:hypothetical protein [Rhodococcus oryzae]|uniref:hypothetical protein n=1 Tax=Rhodococcus oryzae TaxID=2571143 RepID=UPI0037B3F4BB
MTLASNTNVESAAAWEARLREAARSGERIDLAPDLTSDPNNQTPAPAEVWGTDRQIPASALRVVLSDPDIRVDPRGLWINGAQITSGPVDLANVQFNHPFGLTNCRVEGDIDLTGSALKHLALTGSHISSLHLCGTRIDGSLLANEDFTAAGEIRAIGARIGGQAVFVGATLRNPGGTALDLDKATVDTGVFLGEGFSAEGEVRALGAHIGGELALNGAALTNPNGTALNLDGVTIDGGLFAALLTAEGEVRAVDAQIRTIQLSGATLTNPNGTALNLDGVTIDGGLFARVAFTAEAEVRFTAKGEVRALNARIGLLELDGARLTNPGGVALGLDRANVESSVLARSGFTAIGEIRAVGAHVGGQISLTGAALTNPRSNALHLDRATIDGGIFAPLLTAEGAVRAIGAHISTIEFNGATLTNPHGHALNLDRTTIDGGIFAREGFTAEGAVRAVNAHISTIEFNGATLTNPHGHALSLDRTSIDGALFAREGFTAEGEVCAVNAHISILDLNGATLTNPHGHALHLDGATIATLRLARTQVDGTINLSRATITDFRTPETSIPGAPLIATGWQITDIHGLIRTDRRAAQRWLDTAPPTVEFTAQPWYALAGVYDRNGQPADARQLRFAAANKVTRHAPWYSKPLRWLYLLVAGHGYYPLLATVWLLAALSLGTALVASHRMDFVPTDPSAAHASAQIHAQSTGEPIASPITADVPCTRYPTYPCFEPLTYTLTNVIPASSLNPRPDWRAESEASLLITFGLPILRILSWIFTAILLAGVTGLLRKA